MKGSSDDFRDLFGPTCGDPPPSLPPADPVEAVNRSSLPFLRARGAPFCFEGSDFAPPDPPERRSPPLRGSEVGGEPNKSAGTEGPDCLDFLPVSCCCLGGGCLTEEGLLAEEEEEEEENRSSTCGFPLVLVLFFPVVAPETNRSSSDSLSSNRPPSFSLGLTGLLSFSVDFPPSSGSAT